MNASIKSEQYMSFTQQCNEIFNKAIDDYHVTDNVDTPINNPYERESIDNRLYLKCWIDTVQWHLEDIIRDPHIDPIEALSIKRRIDRSNQDRTDLVEQIDSYFRQKYSDVTPLPDARLNTESPAWAVDRLSILALKIYHMREQTQRTVFMTLLQILQRSTDICPAAFHVIGHLVKTSTIVVVL